MTNSIKYRLGDVCRVINGRAYAQEELLDNGKYKVLRVGNFFSSGNWYYSDLELDEDKYCFYNDLLFAWSASFGPRIWKEDKTIYHYHIWKLNVEQEKLNKEFFFYYLKNITQSMLGSTHGSIMLHLTKSYMEDLVLNVPADIKYQINIAKVLSDLDSKIELNNKINAELEAMAKLIYDYWFVQFDFPISAEQAASMGKPNAKGKPYKSNGGKMVYNEELKREIPDGWEVVLLQSLVNLIKGNVTPNSIDQDTPYVGLEHIPRKSIVLSDWNYADKVDSDKCKFEKHDILFGKIRPYFHKIAIALTSGITSTDTIVLRSKRSNLVGFSLQSVFSKRFVEVATKSSTGSKMPRADWNVLKDYFIPLPDKTLLNRYQDLFKNTVAKIELMVLENQKLTELRDWLLPMLMNGQVIVKDAQTKVEKKQTSTDIRPAKPYFYQTQLVAAIINASKKNKITHGEMTLAKYTYLVDKLYGVPTYFNYERWHLGPYPKEMKKVVNNRKFFKIQNNEVSVIPQKKEYNYEFKQQVKDAIVDLASIFHQYKGKERSHQTELLATVCKVVEDIRASDLKKVRESMKKWPIELKGEKFKNKAEKFGEEETETILLLMQKKGWNKLVMAR